MQNTNFQVPFAGILFQNELNSFAFIDFILDQYSNFITCTYSEVDMCSKMSKLFIL